MTNIVNLRRAITLFLSFLLVFSVSHEINLTCSDLGRHLANGHFVLKHPGILTSNFYSYTEPHHEFINHHWGAGVIFEAIRKASGFTGLSIFYSMFMLMTFLLVFNLATKQSELLVSTFMALLLIPLITFRREIRPEFFSYFFCSLFLWVLWHIREKRVSFSWIYVLPAFMLLWVNIHIYFVFGLVLVFIFSLEIFLRNPEHKKPILLVLVLSVAATAINPIGIKLTLYPLFIFQEYGYTIIENQSLFFLIRRGLHLPVYTIYFISAALFICFLVVEVSRSPKSIWRSEHVAAMLFLVFSMLAQRNLPYFGLFALVSLSLNAQSLIAALKGKKFYSLLPYCAVCLSLAWHLTDSFSKYNMSLSTGLMKTGQDSAAFFRLNDFKGPIFNNYDIGSYLIFNLFPVEKVFVDNRPEAYSKEFFEATYIPMQENEEKWHDMDSKFQFNCVFFYRLDLTSWAQTFLARRIRDPQWAPVFVDDFTVIFLKRNTLNSELIRRYEIPKHIFGVESDR